MDKRKLVILLGNKKTAWSVVYNGTSTVIIGAEEASINNLSDNALTVESWVKISPLTNTGCGIISKYFGTAGGFQFRLSSALKLYSIVYCATTSASVTNSSIVVADNKWHHVAMTWDDAGDRKIRTWIDGVQDGISSAGDGAIGADTPSDLYIGSQPAGNIEILGNMGWCRVSNSVRYTTTFVPPPRIIYPTVDANTVRLFKLNEGTGTTIIDYSANAQNAALSNGTWVKS